MREVPVMQLVHKGVSRVRLILFEPFRIKKWLCFLIIAFLAGQLGGGGGSGWGSSDRKGGGDPSAQVSVDEAPDSSWANAPGSNGSAQTEEEEGVLSPPQQRAKPLGGAFWFWSLGLITLFLFLALFLMWVNSRFQFVWLHSIMQNDTAIKKPFGLFRNQGNALFKVYATALAALLGLIAALAGLGTAIFILWGVFKAEFEWSMVSGLFLIGLPLLAGIGIFTAFVVFMVYLSDFVIPIMAIDQSDFGGAWRSFRTLFRENRRDLLLFLPIKLLIAIVTGVLSFFVVLLLALVVLLVGFVIVGLPILLLSLTGISLLPWIFGLGLGIPFVVAAILVLMMSGLPFAVFHRSFSLYYLSSLKSKYVPLPL